jgi:hypothetical protein
MAKLNYIIPSQGFEVARDLIAAILTDEFANQEILSSDPSINPTVFTERFVGIGNEIIPALNVSTSRGTITNNSTVSGAGDYTYFIDVYAKAKSKEDERADERAAKRLQKMMGRVMVILEDPQYRTLGITTVPAGIGGTKIEDIAIADPSTVDESTNSIMGRLTFTVVITDVAQLLIANPIDGYQTEAEIDDTGKGQQFSQKDSS